MHEIMFVSVYSRDLSDLGHALGKPSLIIVSAGQQTLWTLSPGSHLSFLGFLSFSMAFFAKPQSTAVKIVDPTTQDESKSQTRKGMFQQYESRLTYLTSYRFCSTTM